jgi:hypothetical protein
MRGYNTPVAYSDKGDFFEEQRFQPLRTRLLLAAIPLILTAASIWQVALKHPWGKQPMSNGGLIFWTVFLWLIYIRLMTVRIVTQVESGVLSVGLRGLWPMRRIPISEINSAKAITFDPVRDFGGYGVRSTSRGKAYISRSTCGVRVKLKNQDVLTIGSARASVLAALLSGR